MAGNVAVFGEVVGILAEASAAAAAERALDNTHRGLCEEREHALSSGENTGILFQFLLQQEDSSLC